MGDPVPTVGSIPLKYLTFNWQAKDKFLEWRCLGLEVKNVFTGPYAATEGEQNAALTINWMCCDGPKLVQLMEQ